MPVNKHGGPIAAHILYQQLVTSRTGFVCYQQQVPAETGTGSTDRNCDTWTSFCYQLDSTWNWI